MPDREGTMIPTEIREFLTKTAPCILGLCRKDLQPQVHRLWGVDATSDPERLRLFVPASHCQDVELALAENPMAAVTISDMRTAQTYQLKGPATVTADVTPKDLETHATWVTELLRVFKEGMGEDFGHLKHVMAAPQLIVSMSVELIYDQTPGKGAGKQVYPEVQS